MSTQIGFIDNHGHPRIPVRVTGTSPVGLLHLDALIDIGFTGFMMLPLADALLFGLVLIGTGDYLLTDWVADLDCGHTRLTLDSTAVGDDAGRPRPIPRPQTRLRQM